MDAKYLAEIKARLDAGRIPMKSDMEALLTEVERLAKENQGLRANSEVQESIISGGRNPADKEQIVRLTMDNAAKDQQIATLKEALKMACERNADYAFCGGTDVMKAKHAKANYQHFIHQAQE